MRMFTHGYLWCPDARSIDGGGAAMDSKLSIGVRSARPSDAARIAGVHARTWQDASRGQLPEDFLAGLSVPQPITHWHRLLTETPPRMANLVAEMQGKVVDFCSFGSSRDASAPEHRGELYGIYVDRQFAGRGAETALIHTAHRMFEASRFKDVML